MWVRSLASLSGLGTWRCCELWCRSQKWLRSHIAVAVAQACGYSSNQTPNLGTSICHSCGPGKGEKTKKEKEIRVTYKILYSLHIYMCVYIYIYAQRYTDIMEMLMILVVQIGICFCKKQIYILIEAQLTYNIVLASGVQHGDSVFLQTLFHYRLLHNNRYNSLYKIIVSLDRQNFMLFLKIIQKYLYRSSHRGSVVNESD